MTLTLLLLAFLSGVDGNPKVQMDSTDGMLSNDLRTAHDVPCASEDCDSDLDGDLIYSGIGAALGTVFSATAQRSPVVPLSWQARGSASW